jgi:ABC-2 type transport system permease protein
MSKFWALLKTLLINNLGISAIRVKGGKNRMEYLKVLGLGTAIAAGIGPSLWLYTKLLIQGFALLAPVGQERAILSLGIVMVSSIIFFFGIFYVINQFYFAGDAQSLLALPLSGWQVLGARFCVVLVYEYLTELAFLLPPLLVFGIKSGASPLYWLYALIGLLLVPLLPLGLATLPTVVIMRYANLGRRKDLFKILGGIMVIVVAMGYQFLFQKTGPNLMDPVFLQNLLTDQNGLMNLISRVFPSTRYLGLALANADSAAGFINLLIFTALSLLAVALAWLVGEKFYFQGLVGSSETTARRKGLTSSDYKKLGNGSPAVISYCMKEIRLLLRTPIYFMNCVLTNFMIPVILVIPFILQAQNKSSPMVWEELINNPKGQIILMAVIIGITMFQTSSNAITATSLSREGKEFYISKYLPLSYQQQILAKLLSGYIFGILGAVLLLIAAVIMMHLDPAMIGSIIAVSLVAIIPVIEAGLLIDILRPKLEWDNEQKAVKQNLNVFFSIIFAILMGGAILYVTVRFIHSTTLATAFMLGCFGLAAVILYYLLMTKGIKQYQSLEG